LQTKNKDADRRKQWKGNKKLGLGLGYGHMCTGWTPLATTLQVITKPRGFKNSNFVQVGILYKAP